MIEKLRDFDQVKFNSLVDAFGKTSKDAASFALILKNWTSGGSCKDNEKIRLRSWSKEGKDLHRYKGREIAKEISELAFGKVIDEYD